jgi:hypothetical protein
LDYVPIAIAGISAAAAVGAAIVAAAEFREIRRLNRELKAARLSALVISVLSTARRESRSGLTYWTEVLITNQSDRANSLIHFGLVLTGLISLTGASRVSTFSEELLTVSDPEFGTPLVPPVNIRSGTTSLRGHIAFEVDLRRELTWGEKTQAVLLVTDGNGQTYEVPVPCSGNMESTPWVGSRRNDTQGAVGVQSGGV